MRFEEVSSGLWCQAVWHKFIEVLEEKYYLCPQRRGGCLKTQHITGFPYSNTIRDSIFPWVRQTLYIAGRDAAQLQIASKRRQYSIRLYEIAYQKTVIFRKILRLSRNTSPPYFSKKESQPLYTPTPHNHPVSLTLSVLNTYCIRVKYILILISSFSYNNIYLLQLGCYPVAVVILHINKTRNWLLLILSREDYMRSM